MDSQPESLRTLRSLLTEAGYVAVVGDGERLLELMRCERPALLLLAVAGPNEIALCAELKGLDATRLTPIILLTHQDDAA
ncbi:MAG: response regulator, partial [Terriglobales bacterium]